MHINLRWVLAAPCFLAGELGAQLLPSAPAERCEAAGSQVPSASDWLERAARAVLPRNAAGRVLRVSAITEVDAWEQSDRPYEPFIPLGSSTTRWTDLASGVEGWTPTARLSPGARYPAFLASQHSSFTARDTIVRPQPVLHPIAGRDRPLNPWAVLADWRSRPAANLSVVQRCVSRDGRRVVISDSKEALWLAESDGTPVRFERMEPEMLWGDVKVAYVWNTWWAVDGGGAYPLGAYRIVGGTVVSRRGIPFGGAALISADSAPALTVPQAPVMSLIMGSGFEVPPPDTVRIGDEAFLLKALDYTHAVVLRRDTVFLLDATTSEARARRDSTWIAALFPGDHPVVLVVTDHVWPHIAGVRFWVARGATVVSHRQSEDLLRKVVSWRMNPADVLEVGKPRAGLVFRSVTDSLRLAGGELVVHALQGLSTEGALAVWLPSDAFLWAGDYVQSLTKPTIYGRDVVRTLDALRIAPARFGAEHVPIGEWAALRTLQLAWP